MVVWEVVAVKVVSVTQVASDIDTRIRLAPPAKQVLEAGNGKRRRAIRAG